MLEGIYLWDAKYGVPTNLNDPESPNESIEAFINEMRKKPQEANANLHGFAQFFSEFLKEAKEHFPDDRAVTQNQAIADFAKDEPIDAVLLLDEMPSDSFDYFASILTHGANLYNLVYTDSMSHLIREPIDPTETENNLTEWQQHLEKLKQAPDTEQEALPTTKTKARKLVEKLVKKRFSEFGIEKFKVVSKESASIRIEFEDIAVSFINSVNLDKHTDDKLQLSIYPYIYIWIEGIQNPIHLDLIYFNKIPFDPQTKTDDSLVSSNISELKANIEKGLEMLMYIYPHIQNLDSLYQFLLKAKDDKHLSRAFFGNLAHIDQRTIYYLAIKTNQPNLSELYNKLKADYIDDHLFALREKEKAHHIRQEEKAKKFEDYTKYPFRKPENPEAEYAKEFDDYVAGLTQA